MRARYVPAVPASTPASPSPSSSPSCRICGGELVHLGDLGRQRWSRCRNCGSEWSCRLPASIVQQQQQQQQQGGAS